MPITDAEILALYSERKERAQPGLGTKLEFRDQYHLRVSVPLPELDRHEKVAVASILNEVVDALGSRSASTNPDQRTPPMKPGIESSEEKARKRRKVLHGWSDMDAVEIQDSQLYRWLYGYASSPMLQRPNFKRNYPETVLRDPLTCFPASQYSVGQLGVDDAIFCVTQTYKWVKQNYGDETARKLWSGPGRTEPRPDAKVEVLEYYDDYETVLLAIGIKPKQEEYDYYGATVPGTGVVRLTEYKNRSEICPVVIPGLIGIDPHERTGKFDGMLGMFWNRAKLAALSIIAYENAIFPDPWVENGDPNNPPKIIAKADGRRGIAGEIQNGRLDYKRPPENFNAIPFMRELERHERLEGGAPQELSGESGSNIRTGRRGEQLLSAVVDPPIQEAHKIVQRAKREANTRKIAIDKAYWGKQKKSFYVGWAGAQGRVDYVPNELWETDENYVVYSHAGADVNGLAIAGLQRKGAGTMSAQGFMEMDPMIDDPDSEMDRIVYEQLRDATLAAFMAKFGGDPATADPVAMAEVANAIVTDKKEVFNAIIDFNKKLQEQQAEAAQAPPDPMAPEAQPGVAALGMPPAIPGLGEGPQDLASLMGSLRMPQMTVPSERPAVA